MPPLGFPAEYAGAHIYGSGLKWTRSSMFSSIIVEANTGKSTDCFRIESSTTNNPVLGCSLNNVHVQTYAADHDGGKVTTLVHAVQASPGDVVNTVVRDSGFTFQTVGYYYGNMCTVEGGAIVAFDNCYPTVAFSTSSIGYSGSVRHTSLVERVNIDALRGRGAPLTYRRIPERVRVWPVSR